MSVWIYHHCEFILSIYISQHLTCLCARLWVYPVFYNFLCVRVYVCVWMWVLCLWPSSYLPLVNKEEVVQKARPVSSDVGSTNPNFSDLMDEFIQERLRAKGTAVSITRTHTLIKESSSGVTKTELAAFSTRRAVVAAAQEVWKFPGICRSSSRQVRVLDPDPQMIIALLMIQEFPLNGLHLQVPAALMSLAQTASQTPLMPFNTPPASLIVSNNN